MKGCTYSLIQSHKARTETETERRQQEEADGSTEVGGGGGGGCGGGGEGGKGCRFVGAKPSTVSTGSHRPHCQHANQEQGAQRRRLTTRTDSHRFANGGQKR